MILRSRVEELGPRHLREVPADELLHHLGEHRGRHDALDALHRIEAQLQRHGPIRSGFKEPDRGAVGCNEVLEPSDDIGQFMTIDHDRSMIACRRPAEKLGAYPTTSTRRKRGEGLDRRDHSARRAELAAFLRARRAELRPEDVGLPPSPRRRVPGLRRDEVAGLAAISVAWYTQLEQAREINPTAQVLDALAAALRLDEDGHRHLRALGGLPGMQPTPAPDDVGPELHLLLEQMSPLPASVMTAAFDYLAWNDAYVALYSFDPASLPPERRNGLWQMFSEHAAGVVEDRDALAAALLAQFRFEAAERPGDRRFEEIVETLNRDSAEFRTLWSRHDVHRSLYTGTVVVCHPHVGRIRVRPVQLRAVHQPALLVSVHIPASDGDRRLIAALRRSDRDLT